MKVREIILTERAMFLDKVKQFAKGHYPDAENETEALLLLFAKSLKHAEEDDHRQDVEIANLKQLFNQVINSSKQSS
jgi:hypothetical protein